MYSQQHHSTAAGEVDSILGQYTYFTASCKRAIELLSQAETISTQFSFQSRRRAAGTNQFTTTSPVQNNVVFHNSSPEELVAKFDQTVGLCRQACDEARASALFSPASSSFEQLQALTPIQRQKIESMRVEMGDLDRQLRILVNRHQMNVTKYQQQSNNNSTSSNNNHNGPNHVHRVLNNTNNNNNMNWQQSQMQQLLETEEDYKKKERESIHRVASGVRQLVSESNHVLGALRGQRARMQETDSRLSQVLSGAGVAQSVVKQLERMTVMDKAIVFGGMGVLTLFMLYLWFFV